MKESPLYIKAIFSLRNIPENSILLEENSSKSFCIWIFENCSAQDTQRTGKAVVEDLGPIVTLRIS